MSTIQNGRYTTIQTLGSGFSAVTKLATDNETGKTVALKIFDLSKNDITANMLNLLNTEYENTRNFNHPNIVRYLDCNLDTTEVKNGQEKKVALIAMEPIMGGELFDYVANSGAFDAKYARYYFKQLLTGLHYIHSNKNAHRDLKPENIMLDADMSLKVIDFGFTCNIAGRNGDGTNSTGVGTPGYMAPEIVQRRPYQAPQVDLFAAAVILFIMYAGHPPFAMAKEDDIHYRCLAQQRADLFWKAHSNNKPEGFFTEEFKDLITSMLQLQPHMRLSMADVIGHPWMQGEVAQQEDVVAEFQRRQGINTARAAEDEERKANMQANVNERRARRGEETRNIYLDADDVPAELQEKPNVQTRTVKQFTEQHNKHINFYSKFDVTEIMTQITNYLEAQELEFKVSDKQFKVTYDVERQINVAALSDDMKEDGEEEVKQDDKEAPIYERCQICIKILKVDDGKVCVDFQRKNGSSILFYDAIGRLKDSLKLCNNTTLTA